MCNLQNYDYFYKQRKNFTLKAEGQRLQPPDCKNDFLQKFTLSHEAVRGAGCARAHLSALNKHQWPSNRSSKWLWHLVPDWWSLVRSWTSTSCRARRWGVLEPQQQCHTARCEMICFALSFKYMRYFWWYISPEIVMHKGRLEDKEKKCRNSLFKWAAVSRRFQKGVKSVLSNLQSMCVLCKVVYSTNGIGSSSTWIISTALHFYIGMCIFFLQDPTRWVSPSMSNCRTSKARFDPMCCE